MTKIIYASILSSILLFGCKNDDESLTPEQINSLQWSKAWTLGNNSHVLVDGQDITADYSAFSIRFESNGERKTYFVSNGQFAFPLAVDTWSFTDETFTSVVRGSDGVIMQGEIGENTLMLTFSMPIPSAGGRADGAYGDFEFLLEAED